MSQSNSQILFRMLDACGDNRSVVRPVEHFSYFQCETDLEKYGKVLEVSGVKFRRTKEDIGVIVTVHTGSSDEVITKQEKLFREATEYFGGEYDGWETELVAQSEAKES